MIGKVYHLTLEQGATMTRPVFEWRYRGAAVSLATYTATMTVWDAAGTQIHQATDADGQLVLYPSEGRIIPSLSPETTKALPLGVHKYKLEVVGSNGAKSCLYQGDFNISQKVTRDIVENPSQFQHLMEANVFGDTDSAIDDASYLSRYLGEDINGRIMLMVYGGDSYNGVPFAVGNVINPVPIIQYLTALGCTPNDPNPKYVALDFEEPWQQQLYANTQSPRTVGAQQAIDMFLQTTASIRAHFGTGVKLCHWGLPNVAYWEWVVTGTPESRAVQLAWTRELLQEVLQDTDFMLPHCYEFWPRRNEVDPALRSFALSIHGTQGVAKVNASDWQGFEEVHALSLTNKQACITVAHQINLYADKTIPIYPSIWGFFDTSNSLCFSTGSDWGQNVSEDHLVENASELLSMPGVTGINLWWAWDYHANTTFSGGTSVFAARQSVIDTFYGSVNPVAAGTFPSFGAAMRQDTVRKHNERVLHFLTRVNQEVTRYGA